MTRSRFLVQTSILVMVIYGANKVTGFVKLLLMTRTFGISAEADAYAAANQLPELLFALLAGGALTAALIPIYSDCLMRREQGRAATLANTVITLTLLGFGGITLLVAYVAPWITRTLLVPHFDPLRQTLTADLMRIMLLTFFIFAVSNVFTGLLQARQHFLAPALGTVLIDLGQIAGLVWLAPRFGIYGMAWGAVLGATTAFLILLPVLMRHRIGYRPALALHTRDMRDLTRLMGPRIVALGALQAVDLVLIRLASGLPQGSIAAYYYAQLIMVYMPRSLFGAAISTVLFPTMAEQFNARRLDELRRTATRGVQATLALVTPAAVGLVALGETGVHFLFPGGRLDAAGIALVYSLMIILSLRLVSEALQDILSVSFYAQHNTRIPMVATLVWMLLHIALSYLLVGPWGMHGLAWASTLAALVLAGALFVLALRNGVGLDVAALQRTLFPVTIATLAMTAVIFLLHRTELGTNAFLVTALVVGAGVYGGVLWGVGRLGGGKRLGDQEIRRLGD